MLEAGKGCCVAPPLSFVLCVSVLSQGVFLGLPPPTPAWAEGKAIQNSQEDKRALGLRTFKSEQPGLRMTYN